MKSFLLKIVKPTGAWARWLVFLTLLGTVVAGLSGQFEIVQRYLGTEALTFQMGNIRISAYTALRALLVLALVFWTTAIIVDVVDKRIAGLSRMRPTTRILVTKFFQIGIYFLAGLIALDMIGLDLTTLAVFGGALGIGIGVGLQKIASNFISGLILLLERSVEQDDLIELPDGTTGFVRRSSARYTLIETFDGKEILIPNEDFITNRVTNWTLSTTKARIQVNIGVSYKSDLEKAQALILEAAREHPRCIEEPEPLCFLLNFGESSVDFTLLFWVGNVVDGRWAPQSDVMFAIWRKFREHGIEIPFPQRDLHIKSGEARNA
ncbi:mechanosensitive ion channel domain-containing protein [Maricaulis sp.]|jgi:small-conductance mechanosensitive channel|uniref:mechanosensitive ion channel family protein n=1 Tax=Maricaulis sp. TaxID=1486257 RepID=UPI00262A705A|nr:mechanosensitive ion channel domain-containing protein [Maricaulis sp.]